MAAIGGPETVRPQGEELLDAGHIRSPESVQLGHLHQPDALEQLRGFFPLEGTDTVVKPAPTHLIEQRGLTYPLWPGENEHGVILDTGGHGTGHGGNE